MYDATSAAVSRARADGGPALIVCETYRYHGHYEGDPMVYRDDEVETWRERDPIESFEADLREAGDVTEDELAAMDERVADLIDEAEAFARESDMPDPASAFEDVYLEDLS